MFPTFNKKTINGSSALGKSYRPEVKGYVIYSPRALPEGARNPSLQADNSNISPDTKVLSYFVPLLVNCRPEHLVNSCVLCSPVARMAKVV